MVHIFTHLYFYYSHRFYMFTVGSKNSSAFILIQMIGAKVGAKELFYLSWEFSNGIPVIPTS